MSKRAWFNVTWVTAVTLATASAAVLAYGADPYWGQFRRGLGLILFTHRLQWVLATLSLVLCLVVVAMIVVGRRRVFWLIALGPVLALFAHRIVSHPMRQYAILDNPACVAADAAASFVSDGDYVVGAVLGDTPYAYPYAALFTAPVVIQANHEQRFILIWSAYANRAVCFKIDREVRHAELQIASMPVDALLLYNGRNGQFINGVTGLTTSGEKPGGFHAAVEVHKVTWGQWRKLHPETKVLPPRDGRREPTTPVLPRYPLPLRVGPQLAGHAVTDRVVFAPTTRPVAVSAEAVLAGEPANVASGPTQLLLVRERTTGVIRAFDRHVDEDLSPFFHRKSDAKKPAVALEDNDSGTEWSASGKGLEGQYKDKQLGTVQVDDGAYWGVLKYWLPDVQWVEPAKPMAAVFDNPPDPKKRPPARRRGR